MKRTWTVVSIALVASVVVTACGGGSGGGAAVAAAKSWFEAFAQLDLNRVKELTCESEKAAVDAALGLLAGGGEIDVEAMKDLFQIDVSGLTYAETSVSGNSATVHISGLIKVSALGQSQDQDVDEDVPLVNEGGAWKVCQAGLPGN